MEQRALIRTDKKRVMFYASRDTRILDLTVADLNYAIDNEFIENSGLNTYIFTPKGRAYLQQLKARQHADVQRSM